MLNTFQKPIFLINFRCTSCCRNKYRWHFLIEWHVQSVWPCNRCEHDKHHWQTWQTNSIHSEHLKSYFYLLIFDAPCRMIAVFVQMSCGVALGIYSVTFMNFYLGYLELISFMGTVQFMCFGDRDFHNYTPRIIKLLGGILVSLRPSLHPSVCLSRLLCPLCNIYSSGWILSILATNDHYHERVCRTQWPLTLTYIFKVIWPWLRKSCPLCSVYSSGWILFIFSTNDHYH